ncbi:MAG: hypothetical protein K2X93_28295 [Candidatus Obscuribacterales bacterium]|nr:hypothetical protein [Candidatus Obscuribacterales bacterium]
MNLVILGTAAGGGFPQWNCNCKYCESGRSTPATVARRLHASIGLSVREGNWFLVNATPDVRLQIENTKDLHPGPGVRETPIRGIFLTDAELDHTIGLLMLREGSNLRIFGSSPILTAMSSSFPVASILSKYATLEWCRLNSGRPVEIEDGLLRVNPFFVDRKPPRYVETEPDESSSDWVIGYRFEDVTSGGSVAILPQLGRFDDDIIDGIVDSDYILLDGTFCYEDDLQRAGVTGRTASQMGHLPLFGDAGIISGIKKVNARRRLLGKMPAKTLLLHINNTNPVMLPGSEERKVLSDSEIEVVDDGLLLCI